MRRVVWIRLSVGVTSWAKPADYLIAYKYANVSEWRRHLAWLEERGYPFIAQLQKELAREKAHQLARGAKASRGRDAEPAIQTSSELEGEIPSMGDDLLAGGA